jgi:hypothetical protein
MINNDDLTSSSTSVTAIVADDSIAVATEEDALSDAATNALATAIEEYFTKYSLSAEEWMQRASLKHSPPATYGIWVECVNVTDGRRLLFKYTNTDWKETVESPSLPPPPAPTSVTEPDEIIAGRFRPMDFCDKYYAGARNTGRLSPSAIEK